MKKNKLFLLGLFVVFAAVLSLSLVSNTFAKYVSSDSGSDTARVAKWGVTIVATDDGESKNVLDTLDSANEAHISVDKELKLLAPGTKGNLISVNVQGQPEVAVNVNVAFTLTLDGWEIGTPATEYMPLVFTAVIGGNTKTYELGDVASEGVYTSISALEAALATDIKAANGDKATFTDLNTVLDLELSWVWAIDVDDASDTALGSLPAAPTLTVSYSITVSQID